MQVKPPRDYNLGGFCGTGKLRVRPTWFFGLCVVEELLDYEDGRQAWRRINRPEPLLSYADLCDAHANTRVLIADEVRKRIKAEKPLTKANRR